MNRKRTALARVISIRWWSAVTAIVATLAVSPANTSAAKILMIVNSISDPETPTNAQDVEVRDLLVSKGHTVNVADDTTVAAADTVGFDLVIISSSVGSTEAGVAGLSRGQFRASRQPVICYEPALWDELLFQRSDVYNNAGGQTAIGIVSTNSAHPLAAGKTGVVEVTDVAGGSTVTMNSSQLPIDIGPDAILIATNATPADVVADAAGRAAIWAFDRGARLVDGATTTAGRKVAFFYNASTAPGAYNQAAQDLFLAAVNWTLTTPADAPIVVIWRSPAAVNASPNGLFAVDLEDSDTSQVNTNAITLAVNGNPVTPSITQTGKVSTITFQSSTLFAARSTNTARLVYSNKATPAQTFTNTLQFVVGDYVTLASSTAYPLSAADTSAPGFRARVVEANTGSGTLPNSSARAEDQLAGRLIDPATSQPFVNEATTTGADASGYFTDPNVINWSQDANGVGAEIGNFRAPAFPDEPIPGIPGTDGINTDNIAAEILTFLELQAGAYTFGVNSDDGFVVASGTDPVDVLRTSLGSFEGGRASADTLFTFVAPIAGLYPFRVLWYEGDGGANLEFFSVDPATGNKTLINDRSNLSAIKAWRQVTGGGRPFLSAVSPTPNNRKVPIESALEFTFTNQGSAVNTNTVQVTLNGQAVPITASSTSGKTVKVTADPTGNLNSSTDYTVRIVYSDNAAQPNTITNQFSFSTVRAPITLPPLQESADGLVVIEAENFDAITPTDTHAWEFDKTPAGYTGDGTMYALPDAPGAVINYPDSLTGAPRLDYKINFVKTGTHYFWFRGSDGGGNSINAGIDGDSPNDTMNNIDQGCCGTRLVPGGTTYTWVGSTAGGKSSFEITTAGVHTINLWMREDGQIVDKMLITTNASFTPTGAGPDQSPRVGQQAPTIGITAPTAGQTLPEGNVAITVNAADADGSIAKVEFFEGANKIGESTTAPFSFTWNGVAGGIYSLTAKATDNNGLSTTSGSVSITVGTPPPQALFLHGATATASDSEVVTHLKTLGLQVVDMAAPGSQSSDANGKAIIVISSSVASGDVAKFASAAVPILNWESAAYDEFGIEANNVNGVTIASQTTLEIIDGSHPLAAGLGAGVKTFYTAAAGMTSLGEAVPSAKIVAKATDGTDRPLILAIEQGAALNPARLASAPARRVGFCLDNDSFRLTTEDGKKLFDAAVNWALGRDSNPPPDKPVLSVTKSSSTEISVAWTNGGTLQETDSIPGTWTNSSTQTNPQTRTTSGGMKFFRVVR